MSNLAGEPQTVSETPVDAVDNDLPEAPALPPAADLDLPTPVAEAETPVALKDQTVAAYLASDNDEDGTIHAHPSEMPAMLMKYSAKAEDLFHKVIHLQAREEMQSSYIGTQARIIDALCERLKAAGIDPQEVLSPFTLAPSVNDAPPAADPKDGGKY